MKGVQSQSCRRRVRAIRRCGSDLISRFGNSRNVEVFGAYNSHLTSNYPFGCALRLLFGNSGCLGSAKRTRALSPAGIASVVMRVVVIRFGSSAQTSAAVVT